MRVGSGHCEERSSLPSGKDPGDEAIQALLPDRHDRFAVSR
jgi:hypothetical protein